LICERLRSRESEIERAIRTRILALAHPDSPRDPPYIESLLVALAAGLDWCLTGLERGERRLPGPPLSLLRHVRHAAEVGVEIDLVLRRCFAGQAIFTDFLLEDCRRLELDGDAVRELLRALAFVSDRMVQAVAEEYRDAAETWAHHPDRPRLDRIRRLLSGEPLDLADFAYEFDATHVGLLIAGADPSAYLTELAGALDRRLLLVQADSNTFWAWLGGERELDPGELESLTRESRPEDLALAAGEPSAGVEGWRVTHRQAKAALSIARRSPAGVALYAESGLICTVMTDEILLSSLRRRYLDPLASRRDAGATLFKTLEVYLSRDRHISSAAAALGVSRQTVGRRLGEIEALLDRPLTDCLPELEISLGVRRIEHTHFPSR
jgi:PucR C-terminal helix-turn-helix domain/GGDEF-like domain